MAPLVPAPGVLDDRVQIGIAGTPPQFLAGPGGTGHELGRITLPASGYVGQQTPAGHGLGGFNYLVPLPRL
jgi:hypothetical protein